MGFKEQLGRRLTIDGRILRREAELTQRENPCLRTEADLRAELGDPVLAKSIYQDYLETRGYN
ncbi:MAG: hypothetical protein AABW47_01250 [Nanoarchaeota archaeon]